MLFTTLLILKGYNIFSFLFTPEMWFLIAAAATIPAVISFVAGYGLGYRKAKKQIRDEYPATPPPSYEDVIRDYPPKPSAPELFE
jgi:hypothetical protein